MVHMLSLISVFILLIACINFMNLTTARSGNRAKEIGIRKVMGSSLQEIVLLLSKEFMKWLVMANIIAWPTAWWISYNWLQKFAYRTSIDPWIFVLSTSLTLIIALVTVSCQSIKVALANPVDSLRSE
jgi:putative ABC transport system permease protein